VAVLDLGPAEGDEAAFVALADGTYVVERGDQGFDLSAFDAALALEPPYRAEAVRRTGSSWAVGARAIVVVELPEPMRGDELRLVFDGAERTVLVDGEPTLASVPELEELGSSRFHTWVVTASRIRGRLWEVEVGSL